MVLAKLEPKLRPPQTLYWLGKGETQTMIWISGETNVRPWSVFGVFFSLPLLFFIELQTLPKLHPANSRVFIGVFSAGYRTGKGVANLSLCACVFLSALLGCLVGGGANWGGFWALRLLVLCGSIYSPFFLASFLLVSSSCLFVFKPSLPLVFLLDSCALILFPSCRLIALQPWFSGFKICLSLHRLLCSLLTWGLTIFHPTAAQCCAKGQRMWKSWRRSASCSRHSWPSDRNQQLLASLSVLHWITSSQSPELIYPKSMCGKTSGLNNPDFSQDSRSFTNVERTDQNEVPFDFWDYIQRLYSGRI